LQNVSIIAHSGQCYTVSNKVSIGAKRIGLLFSSADIDMQLDPARTADIRDIRVGDELFSDGCGLMARRLAVALAKEKKIIFRNQRYTPSVFQIRSVLKPTLGILCYRMHVVHQIPRL
jgi:hypothetical protein